MLESDEMLVTKQSGSAVIQRDESGLPRRS